MKAASEARLRFPNGPHFALLEAQHARSAGDWARAETIFRDLAIDTNDRCLAEARHRMRAVDLSAAEMLLDKVLKSHPADIAACALMGLVWRMADNAQSSEQARWLHEQAGLVQMRPLIARDGLLEEVRVVLDQLHSVSAMPLGQSLRGGSQTRGVLFHRTGPLLAELHEAIGATLATYRTQLLAPDAAHHLLSHRSKGWTLAGSWSVKLSAGGDFHTARIHPSGIVSSALYVTLPDETDGVEDPGWLELGRPPTDLALNLEPLKVLRPQKGRLALFPLTLYHGTTPLAPTAGQTDIRLTVAFDIVPREN